MENTPNTFGRHPGLRDTISMVSFVVAVVIGTVLLNTLVFRSYNVVGASMENTLHTNDRVVVNRAAVTWAHFLGQEFVPERDEIIVFANGGNGNTLTCEPKPGINDQYVIKRVIAFPGERVQVAEGVLTVWSNPDDDSTKFNPDYWTRKSTTDGPKEYTSGDVDVIVPEGEVFVSGDNREGEHSYDSRNGLGTVPFCRIIGPAVLRLFPLDQIRLF
jgi:signal peptidase I